MKKIITILFFLTVTSSYSQVGVYSEPVHTKAEFQVANTTNDRGVLIPRMTTAQLLLIPSPETGLWVYSTDNSTFFYFNGTVWQMIGQNCSIVEDNDLDTKIVVDNGSDNDEAIFTAAATGVFTINKDGFHQTIGDLLKTAGLVTINNS
ncbi:MAG: hypothetical protein IPO21_14655 [Bacteroidales bacterium]|nr:hypothetical protein [Bacteroidales bacterium]